MIENGLLAQKITVGSYSVTPAQLIAAVLAILGSVLLSWLLRRGLRRYSEHSGAVHRATFYTLARLLHYVLLAIGIVIALGFLDVGLSKLALLSGAIGVGLGFGLQTIFSNFVSGLILLFDKSLKLGDFVELASGVTGEVKDIKIRATRIVTNDNIDILVPNSEFVSGSVVNWTHRDVARRLKIPFGVAYGVDKDLVRRAGLEAAAEVPFTLALEGPRRPQVWLIDFGESSLNFELVVWLTAEAVPRPNAVRAAYNWALHSALQRYHIEIPFPQRDINLRGLFGLHDREAIEALRLPVVPAQGPAAPAPTSVSPNDAVEDVTTDMPDLEPPEEEPA